MNLNFTNTLKGLNIIEAGFLDKYQAALIAGNQTGWAYYFPYLLTRNRPGRKSALVVEDQSSICIFLWQHINGKPRIDLLMPPTPMNNHVLRRCIERANDYNRDHSARILRIDAKDADSVSRLGFRIRERKQQYIYSSNNYNNLSGKIFYTLRRNINLIERLPEVELMPYSKSHSHDCHSLLSYWGKLHRSKHGKAGGVGISRRIIDLAGTLPESVLRGQVIYISGKLAAFSFGGEIRPGLACSIERKCNSAIKGLSYYQLRQFLCSFNNFTLVNDGSDAGSTGLRQMKNSFRPIYMHTEYRGWQQKHLPLAKCRQSLSK